MGEFGYKMWGSLGTIHVKSIAGNRNARTVAMDTAFTHLLAMLGGIADPRRAEGKLYGLPHVFLFSILAVMAGANSYRAIHSFIDVHLHRLKETFELNWLRAPAYTTVRGILQGLAAADVEKVFRLHGFRSRQRTLAPAISQGHAAWSSFEAAPDVARQLRQASPIMASAAHLVRHPFVRTIRWRPGG